MTVYEIDREMRTKHAELDREICDPWGPLLTLDILNILQGRGTEEWKYAHTDILKYSSTFRE